ncbi:MULTISPECIES: sensor domain-containing protein [Sinorhizobium]|uniref:sensor domain-containing protein n=1 Tax=Sinorhizobium TaxID=28105 RepID=UPI00067F360D|nr:MULTISPECIES: GGDEF domain-containing phosphodiesterase [Sinorhizobium]WOS67027.1 EAL domain-containing protein [Sinorhizobium fredii GR64]
MENTQLSVWEQLTQFDNALEVIFDAVPQPIIVKDEHSRFRFLNNAACALLGRARSDLIGRTDHDILPAAEADRIRATDQQILETGEEFSLEEEITAADGTVKSVVTQKRRVELASGGLKERLLVATILDVTACRRAEAELRASEERYRSLIELHPQVPWTANRSGEILEVGPRWKEITGFEVSDVLGTKRAKSVHADDLETVKRLWSRSLSTGDPLDVEFRLATAGGGHRWFRSRAAARTAEDDAIVRWFGILEDVDDRRRALESVKESEARFRAIADDAPVMIWVTDESGAATYHSRLWLETTGQTAERSQGLGWADAVHPDNRQEVEAGFDAAMRDRKPVRVEYRLRRADGSWAWVIDLGQPRFSTDGRFLGYVGIALDITDRRKAEQERLLAQKQIHHMARHDALTGLPNWQSLREEFERISDNIVPDTKIAIVCLDLEGFKAVNNAYGRASGDLLLRRVADRLRSRVKQSDILCRLGGDDFVVLRTGIKSNDEARNLAQQLIDVVEVPYELAGSHVDLGVIVGLAAAPKGDQSIDELIQAANIALDQAKAGGRGTYIEYEPGMDTHLQAKHEMKVLLRQALANNALEVHYQPLVNLHTGRLTTCEALVRWPQPGRGQISPAEFIPVAEEAGLIGPLGEWVLRRACTEAAKWPLDISVAVNLSPVQFDRRLAATVCDLLKETGLNASRLELEITESVLLDECDRNFQILKEIRQLGVKIAVDDFGTGYSSLSYLRSFRFDKIKIDRSFVSDLPAGKESLAILRAVAGIGRTLGITTTVEGVEAPDQLEIIKAEGFDEAQGYLFSRPLPAAQLLELMQSWRDKCSP